MPSLPSAGNNEQTNADAPPQFGTYLIFPIGIMWYFGANLDDRFDVPGFWPRPEHTNRVPHSREEIKAEYERIVERQRALNERREAAKKEA